MSLTSIAGGSASAGRGVVLGVRGGENAQRFIDRAFSGATDAQLKAAFMTSVRRRVLPKLRQAVGFRTGQTRSSLRFTWHPEGLALRAVWYATPAGVGRTAQAIFAAEGPRIKADMARAIRAATQGG